MKWGWLIIVLLAASAIAYYYFVFNLEYSNNLLLKQSYDNKDFLSAYNSVVLTDPDLSRPFMGNSTAPLTLILSIDFSSQESKQAYLDHAQWLKESYVDNGKAKLFHKYYVPKEDYDVKSPRYRKALEAICYVGNDTIGKHIELFDNEPNSSCTESKSLYLDILETDELMIRSPSIMVGIDGRDYITIYGNPPQDLIKRRIRSREIKVGI